VRNVRNNERYLAFSPAVTRAFLEDARIAVQFLIEDLEYSFLYIIICIYIIDVTKLKRSCTASIS
jgi:hypothetical protein